MGCRPSAAIRTGGRLVVSIHDVTPAFTDEVRLLLGALDAMGARPRVLKVVPAAAGCGKIQDAPELIRLLRDEAHAGSEVVLHGYTHQAAGAFRGRGLERLRARLFARAAAEFLTLDGPQIAARLEAGRRALKDVGFEPRGFCAPGWLAPRETLSILRRLGFRYYVGMNTLHDLRSGRRRWMPWAGYMGAETWHERLVYLGGWALMAVAPLSPVVKVFLHPQGVPGSGDYKRTLRVLARLVRERRPTTYGRLLDHPPLRSGSGHG
jgi:predicted deacetylase